MKNIKNVILPILLCALFPVFASEVAHDIDVKKIFCELVETVKKIPQTCIKKTGEENYSTDGTLGMYSKALEDLPTSRNQPTPVPLSYTLSSGETLIRFTDKHGPERNLEVAFYRLLLSGKFIYNERDPSHNYTLHICGKDRQMMMELLDSRYNGFQ